MIIIHDPYQVPVMESSTCPFHQKNPGVAFAGCTCHGSYFLRPMTAEERKAYDENIEKNKCPHCGQQMPAIKA